MKEEREKSFTREENLEAFKDHQHQKLLHVFDTFLQVAIVAILNGILIYY